MGVRLLDPGCMWGTLCEPHCSPELPPRSITGRPHASVRTPRTENPLRVLVPLLPLREHLQRNELARSSLSPKRRVCARAPSSGRCPVGVRTRYFRDDP